MPLDECMSSHLLDLFEKLHRVSPGNFGIRESVSSFESRLVRKAPPDL